MMFWNMFNTHGESPVLYYIPPELGETKYETLMIVEDNYPDGNPEHVALPLNWELVILSVRGVPY